MTFCALSSAKGMDIKMKIKKLTAYLLMSGMILGTMSSDLYTIKAQAVETIEETEGAITIGQYAKIISNKTNMGRNRLYKWFRDNGYFISKGDDKNTPKQIYIESGLFKIHEKVIQTENGEILSIKPLITGKGQKYFTNRILESKYLN